MTTRWRAMGIMQRKMRAGPDVTSVSFMTLAGWQPRVTQPPPAATVTLSGKAPTVTVG